MTDLKLETGEGILLQTNDAGLYDGNKETDIDELYLTNRNLIYVHEKSTGMFKSETVVDRIPLSSIAVINGIVQVEQVDDDDYGKSLQIIYYSGKRELLELNVSPKKQYPVWKTAITDAVIRVTPGTPAPQVITTTSPASVVEEEKGEKAFAGATLFAGFKGVVDAAKQTFSEVAQSATEVFNGNTDTLSENNTTESEEPIVEEKKYIFCSNCGEKLVEGSKFCNSCGTPTGNVKPKKEEPVATPVTPPPVQPPVVEPITERKTVYEGELHKCPNCGELLEAFTTKCPSCGYELRGAKNSSSVREFAAKLEAIEAGREQRKSNPIKNLYFGQSLTKTDEQKISLIRSFAIPNTKEDLYEFLILSVSNIDVDSYENDNQLRNDARKAVSDAWKAKFEQAYQKAKLMFADDPKFTEIEKLHSNTNASINKAKWKTWKLVGIIWGILIVVLGIIFTLTFTLTSSAEKKEIQRLENIEIKIEAALEDGDYKLALMNADSLDFNGADSGLERDWEIKRNYWIDKVIEEASKNGVTLERPVDKAEESENNTNSDNASNDLNNQISSNADKNTNTTTKNIKPVLAKGVVANSNKYLQIKEVGYTMVGDYITCIVTITNPSSDTVVELPAFRVTAYDENGKILGSEERILSVIYPKQDFVDQGTLIEVSKKPHKIDVTVLEPDDYNITPASNMEHPVHKQMVGKNISVNSDKITGEVYNPNDYKIDSAMVTVVFRDANGNIVSSEVEFVDQIPSNGSIPFGISLASDAKTTDKVEVYAYIW